MMAPKYSNKAAVEPGWTMLAGFPAGARPCDPRHVTAVTWPLLATATISHDQVTTNTQLITFINIRNHQSY